MKKLSYVCAVSMLSLTTLLTFNSNNAFSQEEPETTTEQVMTSDEVELDEEYGDEPNSSGVQYSALDLRRKNNLDVSTFCNHALGAVVDGRQGSSGDATAFRKTHCIEIIRRNLRGPGGVVDYETEEKFVEMLITLQRVCVNELKDHDRKLYNTERFSQCLSLITQSVESAENTESRIEGCKIIFNKARSTQKADYSAIFGCFAESQSCGLPIDYFLGSEKFERGVAETCLDEAPISKEKKKQCLRRYYDQDVKTSGCAESMIDFNSHQEIQDELIDPESHEGKALRSEQVKLDLEAKKNRLQGQSHIN